MRILIAPDKFKDALDAPGVAAALAAGVRAARPDAETALCPLGDGGEGTGRVLAAVLGAEARVAQVVDPLGRPRDAMWWGCPDGRTAIVEMAEASGLALLRPEERDALCTSSFGTGQLLWLAAEAGCTRVLLCVGGSATVDGGAGCLQALGWFFRGARGRAMTRSLNGGNLARVRKLEPPVGHLPLEIDVLCDVDHALLGAHGAAEVFGPQKGLDPKGVGLVSRALENWAACLQSATGRDVRSIRGGGAAGGLPAALAAAHGARLLPGFEAVAHCVQLDQRLAGCDWCLTGEGRLDEQTAGGKVVAGVAARAARRKVPTVAFVGSLRLGRAQIAADVAAALGLAEIVTITPADLALDAALRQTAENLTRAARHWLAGRDIVGSD